MPSKKLRAIQAAADEELKVDMSPMIDMVFLLLIFFIVNATLIVVKMDKKVRVPLAQDAAKQEDKLGRIVINVYNDKETVNPESPGRYKNELGDKVFTDDKDMIEYVRKSKEKWDLAGVSPKIHLRADREVSFHHVRRAIRNAAKAGVNEVIFISLKRDS